MIGVIIILTVWTIIMYNTIQEINRNKRKLKELEDTLDQYYKERERRLKDKGLIQ